MASIVEIEELLETGNRAWQRCQVQEALDAWQRGLELVDRVPEEKSTASANLSCQLWARLAEVWLARGLLLEAAEAVENVEHQAKACAYTHPELGVLARVWRTRVAQRQRDMDQAQKLVQEAQRMAENLPLGETRQRILALVYLERGNNAVEMSENHEAMSHLLQARTLYQQLNDQEGEGQVLVKMGRIYGQMSILDQSIAYYQQASDIFNTTPCNPVVEHNCLLGWGAALGTAERYAESLERFQAALDLARKLGSEPYVSSCLNNVAVLLRRQGEAEKALELYEEALELAGRLNHQYVLAITLHNIGDVHLELGDAEQAMLNLEKAIQSAEAINYRHMLPDTYSSLSAAYVLLGRPSTAFDHAEKALQLAEEIANLSYAGIAYRALGVAAAALERRGRLPSVVPPEGPEAYFTTSMEILSGMNQTYERTRTLLAWGRYLHEKRERAQRAKSESYLQRAAEQFKRLGLPIPSPSSLGQTV
jgi:tetratricopeptide (TPR) repeat protein